MSKRLVVIDDQSEVRDLVRMILKTENYELFEAGNGEEGLRMIRERHPECVILDLRLPGALGGIDVCRQMQADPELKKVGIVIISCLDRKEVFPACQTLGVGEFLTKPFSFVDLVSAVERASAQGAAT